MSLLFCLLLGFRLLLLKEELGVVTGKLFQLDEEIPQRQLEAIYVAVVFTESGNKCLYLYTATKKGLIREREEEANGLRLNMRESGFQEIRSVLPQEHRICDAGISDLSGIVERCLYDVEFDELEHPCKQETLQFESTLVIRVSEDEENILDDAEEVLLEERIADGGVSCGGKVIHDLQAHCEEQFRPLHVMFH